MAWTESKVFTQFLVDALNGTAAFDMNSDTFKAALYNNTITPSQTVTAANSAYNAGQWASGEVSDGAEWAAGGATLTPTSGATGTTYSFDSTDTVSGSSATLTNVFGALIYDDTLTSPVANQGVCYNYFGGGHSVTNGTFTIVWSSAGIFKIAL